MRRALVVVLFLSPLVAVTSPLVEALAAGRMLEAVAVAAPTLPDDETAGTYRVVRYGHQGPDLVLIHGAHRAGVDEPRFRALARALASAGLRVTAPELPGLSRLRLEPSDLDVIRSAAPEGAALFGISLGGGMALRLAADEPDRYRAVWTLGAHHDLVDVVEFHRSAAGHPYAREVFREAFGPRLDTHGVAPFAERLRRISPRDHIGDLAIPVFALHGEGDPLVEPDHAAHICAEAPRCRSLVTPVLGHAEISDATLGERLHLARWVADALRASRRAPRP